jgi:serine/threonine-protein kinase
MHYLVWTYVNGETLDQIVQRDGKLKPNLAASYIVQVAEGLEIVHQNRQVHGLVKPSNILIGADQRVHILDFGIGSIMAQKEGESMVDTMSTANTIMSGLDCASPESVMETTNLTAAGDQYSLGCVLYYCLTGQFPFTGTAADKMVAHQFKQPTPIQELAADVPKELIAIVERLMQKAPEARYPDTSEVIEALRPLAGEAETATIGTRPAKSSAGHSLRDLGSRIANLKNSSSSPNRETPPPSTRRTLNLASRPQAAAEEQKTGPASPGNPADDKSKDRPSSQTAPKPKITSPDYTTGYREKFTLEDRIGPTGVAIIALLLSVAVWFVSRSLF